MSVRCLSIVALLLLSFSTADAIDPMGAETAATDHGTVSHIAQKPEWRRNFILVWPFKTNVLKDGHLYRKLALGGFQIDRGAGQDEKISFSRRNKVPFYVGHVADKGYLYLSGENRELVGRKPGLMVRPRSLADPGIISEIKSHIRRNIEATQDGLVLGYALDDEISLGRMTSPAEVDVHPLSLAGFREWMRGEYGTAEALNAQWESAIKAFDEVMPSGFETVRRRIGNQPLSRWNLAPWSDFRTYMDAQFAGVIADLVRYANAIDPDTLAGFVGGQGPAPWGGYDYARLSRAVQWMEAYDIHGTNEMLRSWWNQPRRARMLTFFSTRDAKLDSWFFWYYLLHGMQAVIAWPDGWFHVEEGPIAPHILRLKPVFEEVQGGVSEPIVDPAARFDADPIGIYYSHPSIQAGWAMDALVHGRTWPNRTSSMDNANQSMGVLRQVWCRTLEDLGYQYDFVSYLDVVEGRADLDRFKVIVLPKTVCLSDAEAEALERFVTRGGTLVADYLCGVMDEHGRGRSKGALDDLFGVVRDEGAGYQNGRGLTEIDAEKYQAPFLDRFTYRPGALHHEGICVFERGLGAVEGTDHLLVGRGETIPGRPAVRCSRRVGKGRAVYLNLSPLEYYAPEMRFGAMGHDWRRVVGELLGEAGLAPRVRIHENGNPACMIEAMFWRRGEETYLGIVKSPTLEKERVRIDGMVPVTGITGDAHDIHLNFSAPVGLIDLRTGEALGTGGVFRVRFRPWEGNLYRVIETEGGRASVTALRAAARQEGAKDCDEIGRWPRERGIFDAPNGNSRKLRGSERRS